jgi:methionyl-tRNA formyltransferase
MIKKEHGRIDWTEPATMLARQVRAFNPWPSAYTLLAGTLLKIHRAHAAGTAASSLPGSLVAVGDGIHVATGEGILVLDELQLAGRKRLGAREFARGSALHVGTVLG